MSLTKLELDADSFDKLQRAMAEFKGNVEQVVNDVLHNQGGRLIEDSVRSLIPESHKNWKGKDPPAATANSLLQQDSNLAVTVRTTGKYGYLYFPDDGTNTKNHIGNQQFFLRGAENVSDEIIDLCIERLMNNFEEGV